MDYKLYYMDLLFYATNYFERMTLKHFLELLHWKAETKNILFNTDEWVALVYSVIRNLKAIEDDYEEYLVGITKNLSNTAKKLCESKINFNRKPLEKDEIAKLFE